MLGPCQGISHPRSGAAVYHHPHGVSAAGLWGKSSDVSMTSHIGHRGWADLPTGFPFALVPDAHVGAGAASCGHLAGTLQARAMLRGGRDGAVPSQHEGAGQGATAAIYSSPTPRTTHPSKEPFAFALPTTFTTQGPFSKPHFSNSERSAGFKHRSDQSPCSNDRWQGHCCPSAGGEGSSLGFSIPWGEQWGAVALSPVPVPVEGGFGVSGSCSGTQRGGKRHPRGSAGLGRPREDLVPAACECRRR